MEILLNSFKNAFSIDVDNFGKIELSNKPALNCEYDIRNVLSVTEIFDAEREATEIYRIYGKTEYLSLLNGLKLDYKVFSDFFIPQLAYSKNILNSFDFYLVRPAESGYTNIQGNTYLKLSGLTGYTQFTEASVGYIRYFQVVAKPSDFEIYAAGYSNNVYGDQAYAFDFKIDIDVSKYLDNFNFPLTELFLYAQYKPTMNGYYTPEKISRTTWSTVGVSSVIEFSPLTMNIGDYIQTITGKIGDVIGYAKSQFYQTQLSPQTFYVQTPYSAGRLIWKYNPFIPFRLRYFADELNRVNTGTTAYDESVAIPYYATKLDNKTFVWRNILAQGITDPTTNVGVDYPFVNKRRYLFSNIILDISPDLSDTETYNAFKNIWYSRNATVINAATTGDINDIGKPCK